MKNIRNITKAMAITVTAAVAMTLTPVAMFAGFGGKANLFSHNVLASSVDDRTQQDFEDYYDYSSAFMSRLPQARSPTATIMTLNNIFLLLVIVDI